MANYNGTSGGDNFVGTSDDDVFHMENGGNDSVKGGDGSDQIYFGASFTAADRVDGGSPNGLDGLYLDGDYSAGVVFTSASMRNIENLELIGGHSYNLTLNDGNIAAGGHLVVEGSLGVGDTMRLDARHETDGYVDVVGGPGNDTIFGGDGGDHFQLEFGGVDVVNAGAGDDHFQMGDSLTAADHIDGGSGTNYMDLDGDYSGGLKFSGKTVVNITQLGLESGHSYKLTTADGTVSPSGQMLVDGSVLGASESLTFNGSKETSGTFGLRGGAGDDKLTGGAGSDAFHPGGGRDVLTGGHGGDVFFFDALSDSTVAAPDRITDLANTDTINLSAIDADASAAGDQAFTLVSHFSHTAGEAMLKYSAGSDTTTLSMDVDGDGVADSKVLIDGDHSGFTDFVL